MTALTRSALGTRALEALQEQRWFPAKGRAVRGVDVLDRVPLGGEGRWVEILEVVFATGEPERFLRVQGGADRFDVVDDPPVAAALLRLALENGRVETEAGGTFAFWSNAVLHDLPPGALAHARLLGAEQSNTSIRYGDALVFKLYRRLVPGLNPEIEVGQFLTEQTTFRDLPLLAGTVSYRAPDGAVSAAGVFQTFVPNHGDLWSATLRRLAGDAARSEALAPIQRLGEVTAHLHLALAAGAATAFVPEPITPADVDAWVGGIVDDLRLVAAETGLDRGRLEQGARGMDGLVGALKARHHGDFHLGQVLERSDVPGGLAIVDFEGEPARPLAQRREKRSPLRDVAGLLRSLDYARHAAGESEPAGTNAALEEWHTAARAGFMRTYIRAIHQANRRLLPLDEADLRRALAALELEKAAYEVLYELRNRPHLVGIPLAALQRVA